MIAWLRALLAPLNTKTVGIAGVAIATSGGALILNSARLIVGMTTDAAWLLAMWSIARHTPNSDAPLAAARFTGALVGIALGLLGGLVGLLMAWIGYTPTPPSVPPNGGAAEPVPLKRAA